MTTKKKSYQLDGMSCAGCEKTIQKVVANIEGVTHSEAHLADSTITVEYDPDKVSVDRIKTAVQTLGYRIIGERSRPPGPGGPDKV